MKERVVSELALYFLQVEGGFPDFARVNLGEKVGEPNFLLFLARTARTHDLP